MILSSRKGAKSWAHSRGKAGGDASHCVPNQLCWEAVWDAVECVPTNHSRMRPQGRGMAIAPLTKPGGLLWSPFTMHLLAVSEHHRRVGLNQRPAR